MNIVLNSSFLVFTLISLISTLDFDMICIYKRECEISEKMVKTTVSRYISIVYGVERSVERSAERMIAREKRVEDRERREREGRRPLERRWGRRGARYYPDPLSLTVHDALDFCSFVCFLFNE